mmetsp:Transcript_7212/g.13094  ORF Transcript_7212/g.13094 Transcript_7212/m.13094 type:complete len:149 (-) Transcript_7212:1049-1495(-)
MTTPPSSSRLRRTILNRSPSLRPEVIFIHCGHVCLIAAPNKVGPLPALELLRSQAHHIVLNILDTAAPRIHVLGRAILGLDGLYAISSRGKARKTAAPVASGDAVWLDGLYDYALIELAHSHVLHRRAGGRKGARTRSNKGPCHGAKL